MDDESGDPMEPTTTKSTANVSCFADVSDCLCFARRLCPIGQSTDVLTSVTAHRLRTLYD